MIHIPLLSTPDTAIISSTQDFLPVADIEDGIILYKTGGAALIMESSSLNFALLSEREQDAVIAAYAGLLNSFNFSVQIVVRSQKKDISSYMNYLDEAQKKISNPKLLKLMDSYKDFISEAIKKKNVLSKKFYITVPFTPYELGVAKSMKTTLTPTKIVTLPYPKSYILRKAKIALLPKRDHLMRQVKRLGIGLHQLNDDELKELLYDIYNPEAPAIDKEIPI